MKQSLGNYKKIYLMQILGFRRMNYKDAIEKIDIAIANIHAQSNMLIVNPQDAYREGERLKHTALNTLKNSNASLVSIDAIKSVSFSSSFMTHIAFSLGYEQVQQQSQQIYTKGLNALISILQQEKELCKQHINEEKQNVVFAEQRKSNLIQKRTFWCSIIATTISLIALIVAICK